MPNNYVYNSDCSGPSPYATNPAYGSDNHRIHDSRLPLELGAGSETWSPLALTVIEGDLPFQPYSRYT